MPGRASSLFCKSEIKIEAGSAPLLTHSERKYVKHLIHSSQAKISECDWPFGIRYKLAHYLHLKVLLCGIRGKGNHILLDKEIETMYTPRADLFFYCSWP